MSKAAENHKATSPKSLGIFIITCSTSRYKELKSGGKPEDQSGEIIERLAANAGHAIKGRLVLNDSKADIQKSARKALANEHVDALIITGGTGLSPRDVTIEAIRPIVTKEIDGFGELFRKLSYDKIGPAAMLSRAFAGLVAGKPVFCLPGSPDAVQTAMEQLILPETGHLVRVSREH